MARRFFTLPRQIHRDENGSVVLLSALAMLMTVIAVGAAVDLSRGNALQAHLGSTLDAATLAAANASINIPCNIDTTSNDPANQTSLGGWVQDQGTKYFNMNLPAQYLGSALATPAKGGPANPLFILSSDDPTNPTLNDTVTGSSTVNMPNSFMQIAGDSTVSVNTCSQVHIPLNSDLGPSVTATSPHVHGDVTTGLFTDASGTGGTPYTVNIATNGIERVHVDQNGDTWIGPATNVGDTDSGNLSFVNNPKAGYALHFSGPNGENTDDMFLQRFNDAADVSELRLVIGDNAVEQWGNNGLGDAFIIGALDSTKSGAWQPRFTFSSDGTLLITNTTSTTQGAFQITSTGTLNSTAGNQGKISMGGGDDMTFDGGGDSVFIFKNIGGDTGGTGFTSNYLINNPTTLSDGTPNQNILYMENTGNVGIKNYKPAVTLDVAGDIKVGNDDSAKSNPYPTTCDTAHGGAIRYHNGANSDGTGNMEYCNNSVWVSMGGQQYLNCTLKSAAPSGIGINTSPTCAPDEVLTGGGAWSEWPTAPICGSVTNGWLQYSAPHNSTAPILENVFGIGSVYNAWDSNAYSAAGIYPQACSRSFAICCKITTTYKATTGSN